MTQIQTEEQQIQEFTSASGGKWARHMTFLLSSQLKLWILGPEHKQLGADHVYEPYSFHRNDQIFF
jgi:hypothetical protein